MLQCYLLSKIIVWLEYLVKCQSVLSCQSHQEKYGLWFCPEGPVLVPEGSAVCLYFQSMSEHSKHHGSPWPCSFQTNLSTKLTEHWGQDVTVCRVCGPTVVWLPVYSVCDQWRNFGLQFPEQHSDNRYTHTCWSVVCGWDDSYPPEWLFSELQTTRSYKLWLGLTLALLSAFLIGGSVILKKKALLRLATSGHTRAGDLHHQHPKLWVFFNF